MPTPLSVCLAVAMAQEPAHVQESADAGELTRHELSPEAPFELASWAWPRLRTARDRWADNGFTFEAYFTFDASSSLSGGAHPGSGALRGLFDAVVAMDGERVMGIRDSHVVIGLQAYGGDDGSDEVGVLQNYSNIDAADDRVQIARVWYEQSWNDEATQLRIGKMDANALFAGVSNATHFIHSSMGYSPTILGFPTYPDTAFGLAFGQAVSDRVMLRFGVFDGAAVSGVETGSSGLGSVFDGDDEAFLVAQAHAAWDGGGLTLGGWYHTGTFTRFDGGEEDGEAGPYLVLDQQLGTDSRGRSFASYLQLGHASEAVASITDHVGAGVVANDVFLPQRRDTFGLGVSYARLSDAQGAGFSADAETAFETFWGVDVVPGVRIKPDLQYILDPGGDANAGDAWVLTVRLTASL